MRLQETDKHLLKYVLPDGLGSEMCSQVPQHHFGGARPRPECCGPSGMGVEDLTGLPYPVKLCRDVAQVLAKVGPRAAFLERGEQSVSTEAFAKVCRCFAEGSSRVTRSRLSQLSVCGEWPPTLAPFSPLPAREHRPWPKGAEQGGRHTC